MTALLESPPDNLRLNAAGAMEACRMDPLGDSQWNELVARHPEAGIFHTRAWARVLHQTYGHRPFYFEYRHEGRLAALVPLMEVCSPFTGRRGISVPFADFCGPLVFEGCNHSRLIKALEGVAAERRWKYLEFRGGDLLPGKATPSVSFYAHTLDLRPGHSHLLEGMESSVRRAIGKAERSGLTAGIRTDEEAMLQFFRLHGRTRRRHGLPPQPLKFFRHILGEILHEGIGSIVLVSREKQPVAASVFFHSGPRAIYKFGASDDDFHEFRPNNLAMWTGIRFLADRGCESLHFGRTSTAHEGLRRFKLGWGAAEAPLHYFRYDPRTASWTRGRDHASGSHTTLFSRLPLPLNRLLGGLIYPHLD